MEAAPIKEVLIEIFPITNGDDSRPALQNVSHNLIDLLKETLDCFENDAV